MADDSDFTAPCATTNAAGARCLLEARFLDGVEQPHEHQFPPSIADKLRLMAAHDPLRRAVLTEAADWLDQSDEILRAHATALPSMVAELQTLRELAAEVVWEPDRWWRVTAPDGELWCETTDEQEARANVRPGDTLARLFIMTVSRTEWRREEAD